MLEPKRLRTMLLSGAMAALLAPALALGSNGTGGVDPDPGKGEGGTAGSATSGVFPIKGRHSYGDGLGAGRNHQGQDLLAKCGKPVRAAQSGKVRFIDYQASGAGNYVVIKGSKSGFDTVYMHLAKRASVRRGERVGAGEQIGVVGTTGSSSACHLHFEMWTRPGWYRGGDVTNPKPYLKRWDRNS